MNTLTFKPTSVSDRPAWKTEEYHGKQMHVCTRRRQPENDALSGHGSQWTFTVKITDSGAGPMDDKDHAATADPELFYSTQAIAEDMGFLRGRELIEAS